MFVPRDAARAGRRVRRELRDGRAAATRTSSCTSGWARHPTSRSRRSSARVRSTRCTAAPPPTSPTRRDAATACSATASTTPTCAAGLFRGPGKPMHYVGRISTDAARRTKAAPACRPGCSRAAPRRSRRPARARRRRCPKSSRRAFIEAVWRSLPWERTTWLGRRDRRARPPICSRTKSHRRVRPDWIIETGTGDGGRALFLASICELLGHGEVVSIDDCEADASDDRPARPGRRPAPASAAAIRRRCGPHARDRGSRQGDRRDRPGRRGAGRDDRPGRHRRPIRGVRAARARSVRT